MFEKGQGSIICLFIYLHGAQSLMIVPAKKSFLPLEMQDVQDADLEIKNEWEGRGWSSKFIVINHWKQRHRDFMEQPWKGNIKLLFDRITERTRKGRAFAVVESSWQVRIGQLGTTEENILLGKNY